MHKLVIFTLVNNFQLFQKTWMKLAILFTNAGVLTTKMRSKISYHVQILCTVDLP
jgi:hypothetical protein